MYINGTVVRTSNSKDLLLSYKLKKIKHFGKTNSNLIIHINKCINPRLFINSLNAIPHDHALLMLLSAKCMIVYDVYRVADHQC